MSDAVAGYSGQVKFGGNVVAEVRNWTLSRATKALDATSMSSNGWREKKAGIREFSGSFEMLKYLDIAGSSAVGSFYTGTAAGSTTPVFSGTILITDEPTECPFDDLVVYKVTFEGSGSVTAAVS